MLDEARQEIERQRADTEARLTALTESAEAAASELGARTDRQVATQLDAAGRESEELVARAREECRSMVEEAQGLRARVLADLSKRRKVLHAQIEQLRAGRERLAETVQDVRRSVDLIADDLFAAEDNARLAAEAAGREALDRPDEGTPEEMAALLLAVEAEADTGGEDGESPEVVEVVELVEVIEADEVVEVIEVVEVEVEAAAEDAEDAASGVDQVAEPPSASAAEAGRRETVEGEDASPVDALFAKIRAASEQPEPPERSEPPPGASGKAAKAKVSAGKEPDRPVEAPGDPVVGGRSGVEDEAEGGSSDDGPPEERDPLAVRRDELTAPIVTAMGRRLKRTLQDNQNDLLDSLRSSGSHWSSGLLPDETEQVDSVATAALPALEQAVQAGVSFVDVASSKAPHADVVVKIAHELAESMIGPLRRKLLDADGLEEADESVVAEHIGSAFREWRGERIERLAADHVLAAFSAGSMSAAEGTPSAQLEWIAVAGSGDAPCPDCEDNGLNGSLRPGEEFPTGHLHPPAHPGCRCLLALAAT
jgi:hypothetical protein